MANDDVPPRAKTARAAVFPAPLSTHRAAAVHLTFFQLPWVQNLLPFITSIFIHGTIVVIGVVFFYGVQYITRRAVRTEEVTIPDIGMIQEFPPAVPEVNSVGGPHPSRPEEEPSTPASVARTNITPASDNGETFNAVIGLRPKGGHGDGLSAAGDGFGELPAFGPGGGRIGANGPVFGPTGNAKKIAFVCDASGSMLNKFSTLRRELSNTVQGLRPNQSFSIVFFQEKTFKALDENALVMATPENKLKANNFLSEKIVPRGETDPVPGLEVAFRQKPDLIYILTDGDFPDNAAVLRKIHDLNAGHHVKINTIAFVGEGDSDIDFKKLLKQIAEENGGIYRFVKESDL